MQDGVAGVTAGWLRNLLRVSPPRSHGEGPGVGPSLRIDDGLGGLRKRSAARSLPAIRERRCVLRSPPLRGRAPCPLPARGGEGNARRSLGA